MFNKILIANRGEIACRVAATARRLGVGSVAVYSDADVFAKHVTACDEAVYVGGSAPGDSYLRGEKIIAAALAQGAQAIHPGYGFLSENASFAQACLDAGLVFIGPSPAAISAMGRKAESKQRMAEAGVPVVPGYHGADQDPAHLQRAADAMGYPVLIKASAGGGGKGMRVVDKAEDFAAALVSCQHEAEHGFGDAAVLIEKYVQRPRHIEIQVFGDTHGHCVYLFERDCSVQRRHQKVLEEAPAPGLSAALRQRMGETAVAAAQAVNYVGAGTVEFIVETTPTSAAQGEAGVGAFYFMEMNTRLQVEHPVTEAITGLDLVEWQLRVACGEPLPLRQDQLHIQGHAIEARICAENPDNSFLPSTGTLRVFSLPPSNCFTLAHQAIRVDAGVRPGDSISPFYDSMVAKLIVHGRTRAEALKRMDSALAQTHIVGLPTNVQFLRHVVQSPSFALAQLDTDLITREAAVLFDQKRVAANWAVASAIAFVLQQEDLQASQEVTNTAWFDPWARRDAWQAYAQSPRCFDFVFAKQALQAQLHSLADGTLELEREGTRLAFAHAASANDGFITVCWANQRLDVHVYRVGHDFHIFTPQGAAQITLVESHVLDASDAASAQAELGRLTAPMPGRIVSFAVQTGQRVQRGQALAVLDAMKMEHTIAAPKDGTVGELLYACGDQVAEGAALLTLID